MEESILFTFVIFLLHVVLAFTCPTTRCTCELDELQIGRLNIECAYKGLTEVPTFTPDTTTYYRLILRGNRITEIKDNAFAGIGFEELDLMENRIATIQANAFKGTNVDIKSLTLHSNGMSEFPTQAINVQRNLVKLEINNFFLATLPPGPFQYLTKLEDLTITASGLGSLQANVFDPQRNVLKNLDLHDNSFSSVPSDAIKSLSNLEAFIFSYQATGIAVDSSGFSGLSRLKTLDLSQNAFSLLNSDAFNGLENSLEEIKLDHCTLNDNDLSTVRQLRNLKTLKLNNNNIVTIATDILASMQALTELDLQNNRMNSINEDIFRGIGGSLKRLYLEGNQLSMMSSETFKVFDELTDLHLDGQAIASFLTEDTFQKQSNTLQTLSLKATGFTSQQMAIVSSLEQLNTLVLSDNNLQDPMPDYVFRNVNKLKTIDLSGNKFTAITQEQLFGLQDSLKLLNLRGNEVFQMEECALHQFPDELTVYQMNLDQNPLHCDCNLKWLKEKHLREQDTNYDFLLNWQCETPFNKRFVDATSSEFTCSGSPNVKNCDEIYWQFTTTPEPPTPAPETTQGGGASVEPTAGPTPGPSDPTTPPGGNTDSIVDPTDGTDGTVSIGLIAGAAGGAVVVIILIIVVVVIVCKRRNKQEKQKATFSNGAPAVGYGSKRFTRPPPSLAEIQGQNQRNTHIEGTTGGVDKNPQPARGKSTVSTISNGSLHPRYVDDPTGGHGAQPAYPYPPGARGADYDTYELNDYDEIPADEGYEEIHGRKTGSAYPGTAEYNVNHPYDLPDSPVGTALGGGQPPVLPDPRQYNALNAGSMRGAGQGHANSAFTGDYGQTQPGGGPPPQLPPNLPPQPALAGQANLGFVGDYGQGLPQQNQQSAAAPPPLPPGHVNPAFEGDYGRRKPYPSQREPSSRGSPSRHRHQPEVTPYHVADVSVNIPRLSTGEDTPVHPGYDPARDQYIHTPGEGTTV